LPQKRAARDHDDRRDSGVPDADAQSLGIIGPIPLEEFRPESIEKKIRQHPLLQGARCRRASRAS